MTKLTGITRREFISGIAVTSVTAGLMSSTSPLAAMSGHFSNSSANFQYPPLRTGMRGSHEGSFEVAHNLAWAGERPATPTNYTDDLYDLVVVGGGISGLTSAWLARKKLGADARILILDNHDDFGGHAKRNEFEVNGQTLVGHGGSQTIDAPATYSDEAKAVFEGLGIDVMKFYDYFDQDFYPSRDMIRGIHFSKEGFNQDKPSLYTAPFLSAWGNEEEKAMLDSSIDGWPVSEESRASIKRLLIDRIDWVEAWMPGASKEEKIAKLKMTNYKEALIKHAGLTEEAYSVFAADYGGMWGIEWDSLSVLEAIRAEHGGAVGLGISSAEVSTSGHESEPYITHFPDGNASVARLLVRELVPDSVTAPTMEDMATAKFDYDTLDRDQNTNRIRLNATVIEAKNNDGHVDVTYVRDGKAEKVKAKKAVMAAYAHMLPHILPEMSDKQKEAIEYPEKTPLAYINIALTNWRAWEKAGVYYYAVPKGFYQSLNLDFPVSIGEFEFAKTPDDPVVVHCTYIPESSGANAREKFRDGRRHMYSLTFEDFEKAAIKELSDALGPYGFDAERDIAGITVNRWPHGYAYEYFELYDDHDWSREKGPHIEGRQSIGNIAIAGSDASAFAYVDGALDAAVYAVNELFK